MHTFRAARRDQRWAVLEGFHALKHAVRFGAQLEYVVAADFNHVAKLGQRLAPDVSATIASSVQTIMPQTFAQLAPVPPETGVLALAKRPQFTLSELLQHWSDFGRAPLIVLERPTNLGNVGAAVRVAAAAGVAGLLTTGPHDPWHPAAIRGAAGLQFALPVGRISSVTDLISVQAPLIGLHPGGEPLSPGLLPARSILVFGSERHGLSAEAISCLHRRIAIPMAAGVSSLNLATAVAIALYSWRLHGH